MKALLLLDPDRHADQLVFASERAQVLVAAGERLWVEMNEALVDRFADAGIVVQPQEGADLIELPAVVFDPKDGEPRLPAGLVAAAPPAGTPGYHVVQFVAPPEPDWLHALEEIGGSYLGDVPSHAALFKLSPEEAAAARESPGVAWVGLYHPAYALGHELAGREEPVDAAGLAAVQVDAAHCAPRPEGALRVFGFADVDLDALAAALAAAGAEVAAVVAEAVLVNADAARVTALLRVDGVRAIEPYRPPDIENQRAGVILGANQVRNFGSIDFLVNLDGSGEIAAVFDTGLDNGAVPTSHTDFHVAGSATTSRVLRIDNLNPAAAGNARDFVGHGTHVAGSIVADGRNAPPPIPASPNNTVPRGVAPGAGLVLTSVNNFPLPPPANRPLDFSRYLQAFGNHYGLGARVQSNSWGAIGPNVYTNETGSIDRYAWLHPDTVVLFAAGNDEADLNNDGRFDQNFLGPEVTGKNTLVIGATENVTALDGDGRSYQSRTSPCNRYGTLGLGPVRIAANAATPFSGSDNAQHVAMFSSRGRVRNFVRPGHRRVKPDLVAPGTNIVSTRSSAMGIAPTIGQTCPPVANPPGLPNPRLANTAPQASYYTISGTSMATPLSAGACLLVRQFYRQRYGQLRRPELVQALGDLIDQPASALAGERRVLAWVKRDAAAGRNDIVAALYDRDNAPRGAIATLATAVGDQSSPLLVLHGERTLLAYRDGATLKLAAFDAALQPVAAFGTAGVATIATTRTEAERRPAIALRGDEVALAFFRAGSDELLFQRWSAATGAKIDTNPVVLGQATATATHPWLLHNGARWAAFFRRLDGGQQALLLRFVSNAGQPEGAAPLVLLSQPEAVGEPHAAWDPAQGRFVLVYASEAVARGVVVRRVDAGGALFGIPVVPVLLAAPRTARRPRIERHPDGGFVLLWEDDSQGSFDLYLAFTDAAGVPGAIARLQVSDTPDPIAGYTAVVDGHGVVPVWLSSDEANSDVRGLYLLGVGKNGVFAAQQDPATPLLENAFHVRQTLLSQPFPDRPGCVMVWAGGDYYFARLGGDGVVVELQLVHTHADGAPDAAFGPNGAVRIEGWIGISGLALAFTGSQLVLGWTHGTETRLVLLGIDGRPVPTFGRQGVLDLLELAAEPVGIQLATRFQGGALRIHAAFGGFSADGVHHLRYTVRDARGAAVVAARDLARIAGTARQGWFELVPSEAPGHFVAAWHVQEAGVSRVRVQRYRFDGTPQPGRPQPIALSTAAGDALNPVIAARPVQFQPGFPVNAADLANSRRREYGAAWQQRPAGQNWQVWFSRLDRSAVPVTTAGQFDLPVVVNATDHATDPQLVWHGAGYGLAWRQQPAAGGPHVLMFTVLDPLGQRPNLAVGGAAASPAADFAVTAATVDVQAFHLIWAGASFRITWTEIDGAAQLHRQRAIALPLPASGARYDAPFQQPSAALIRATLINGATNLRGTPLPNFGNDVHDGYGWGRINLRQALAPAPPVTFHVRDDGCVGPGRRVRYAFRLRRGTRLLRVTLAWTDPPGADLVNHLHLRVTTPPFAPGGVQVLHGNRWRTDAGNTHLSAPVPARPPAFEDTHNVQQVVLAAPPDLPEGPYIVEVICSSLGGSAFQAFPGQPFALVFVGSGPELTTAANPAANPVGVY